MIYRLSIYYYRYSLLWPIWEKCRSPISLANFGTTPLSARLPLRLPVLYLRPAAMDETNDVFGWVADLIPFESVDLLDGLIGQLAVQKLHERRADDLGLGRS